MIEQNITKLQQILLDRGMTQADLMRAITEKTGFQVGRDRISRIVNGNLTNYTIETAVMIAESLTAMPNVRGRCKKVRVDDIIELKEIQKINFVQPHYPKKMGAVDKD
jgi:transcriptional regulator with XRE-family HTH domain